MKKLSFMLAIAALVSSNLFAQEEAESDSVKGLSIHGEIWARGWAGSQTSGANLKEGDTFINFEYKFSEHSGVVFGINADGAVPTGGEAQQFNANLGDVYGYTDILREFGVKAVGLRFQVGKFAVENKYYNPGSFGTGDDSITVGDASTDMLNMLMEFNVSRDLVPLLIRVGGDLDMGHRNQQAQAIGNNGFGALVEVALDNMEIADAVVIGANVYGVVRSDDIGDDNILQNDKPNFHIGGTLGVSILNLPVNLKVGGSLNYFNLYDNGNNVNQGMNAQAAAEVGMDDIFTASLGYNYDPQNGYGHFLGMKASLDLSTMVRPYVGFGFRLDNAKDGFDNNVKFGEKNAVEVGVQILPIDGVELYLGWSRVGASATGNVDDPFSRHHRGGDVHSPTQQNGWGAIYLKAGFIF